jgi:hypothetical protein
MAAAAQHRDWKEGATAWRRMREKNKDMEKWATKVLDQASPNPKDTSIAWVEPNC